jgi:hypothetical protein
MAASGGADCCRDLVLPTLVAAESRTGVTLPAEAIPPRPRSRATTSGAATNTDE